MDNPLLDFSDLPRFDKIEPAHIAPALDQLLAEATQAVEVAQSVSPVTWESFVTPVTDATERLGRAWGQVGHLHGVVNTPALREAYNANLPRVTRFFTGLGQNLALYNQYKRLAASTEYQTYDAVRRKVLQNTLRDFKLGGAELADEQKTRLSELKEELSTLTSKFSQNVLDATDGYSLYVDDPNLLQGLPADVLAATREAARKEGKPGHKLGLQAPVLMPVLTYADNRGLREQLYRAYGTRASEQGPIERDNSPLIRRIVELRREMAALLQFNSFADYSVATKMATSPAEVAVFLRELAAKALPAAKNDRQDLEQYAISVLRLDELQPWDVGYVSEKLRLARYEVSALEVKQYFTEPKVLAGLFDLIHSLYGVNIQQDSTPAWHEDVRFFRVVDSQNHLIGQFYLDLYAREGKNGGAWMDDCRNRRDRGNGWQTPVVYLTCNFGKGQDGKAATFTHDEVITLFHEMGHGLHQLLTQVGELGVAGINGVEWDAVELPSQFMENFCWEWDRLQQLTAHVETGEPLPRQLCDRMIAAKNFQSGMAIVRQIEFSLFDMLVHDEKFDPVADDVMTVLEKVRDEVAVNRPPSWHRFPQAFGHIFAGGYAAGYYSYKWAEVLSADVYAAFEESDDLKETGERFRREILSRGGSRSAAENFEAFRGRKPGIEALLRHAGLAA
jgi:oligopeptidase A